MSKAFLQKGNGHQVANRRKAMAFALEHIPDIAPVDEATVRLEPYGLCRFAAFTHPDGAMVSAPTFKELGSADWHSLGHSILFRDVGDGRVMIYVCPIPALFDKRSIGEHGVPWEEVRKLSMRTEVLRV
jgi:hypothetical protein